MSTNQPFTTPDTLKVGDIVWINIYTPSKGFAGIVPTPYTVTSVEDPFFYTVRENGNQNTMQHVLETGQRVGHRTYQGIIGHTYPTKEAAQRAKKDSIKRNTLLDEIELELEELSLDQLIRIHQIVKETT